MIKIPFRVGRRISMKSEGNANQIFRHGYFFDALAASHRGTAPVLCASERRKPGSAVVEMAAIAGLLLQIRVDKPANLILIVSYQKQRFQSQAFLIQTQPIHEPISENLIRGRGR